jgi:uncharacterized protein DUF5522
MTTRFPAGRAGASSPMSGLRQRERPALSAQQLFCQKCLEVTSASISSATCRVCGAPLAPLFDNGGALSREFLEARGSCCGTGCKNCPYPHLSS